MQDREPSWKTGGMGAVAYERSAAGWCVGDRAMCAEAVGLRQQVGECQVADLTHTIGRRPHHLVPRCLEVVCEVPCKTTQRHRSPSIRKAIRLHFKPEA